ncbi:MAG: Veg family protein [Lachnospiraceae bacterium]|nr:Veg family protein [Lachnospiraceae bacterium]
MANANVVGVRRAVAKHVGSKVLVRSNLGRHKYDVTEGVIAEIYPSIFLIKVKNEAEDSFQTVSYSYTDVITRDVQLTLC